MVNCVVRIEKKSLVVFFLCGNVYNLPLEIFISLLSSNSNDSILSIFHELVSGKSCNIQLTFSSDGITAVQNQKFI